MLLVNHSQPSLSWVDSGSVCTGTIMHGDHVSIDDDGRDCSGGNWLI